ncbi:beta-2-microglobulin-like [Hyperolius riggenbachi]|uniref:beta-2-microglobulin-like n=1 Tax=Hyperolius riggenbachi TaxID=752182 RepID=UPI0035A32EA6
MWIFSFSPPEPPQVYVYTRHPPEKGKANQLICHCTNFHPPRIDLALKAEGRQLDDCQQSDMTFKEDWAYYTTMHKDIIYEEGKDYSCEVRHNDGPLKTYRLDPLM